MDNYKISVGYLYKDSFTEKQFLDAVLKKIKDDFSAPSYVFDEMVLGNIERINVPLFLCDGESVIEYSRKIGYDTLETTTKIKTTTYGNGYQNQTRKTSCRTITNWVDDSGTISGTASSGTYEDDFKIYDEYITNHVMDKNNIRVLSEDELSKYQLTEDQIDFLKDDILKKVYDNNMTFPGNHIKDEEYNYSTNLYNISCTIVSLYSINIKVRDSEIQFIASSNGEIEIESFGEYPVDNFDDLFKFTNKINAEKKEATKASRFKAKLSILSSLLLFALLLILGLSLDIIALTIASIVVLVLGFIIFLKFMADINKIKKPFNKQIFDYSERDFANKKRNKEESYESYIRKLNN